MQPFVQVGEGNMERGTIQEKVGSGEMEVWSILSFPKQFFTFNKKALTTLAKRPKLQTQQGGLSSHRGRLGEHWAGCQGAKLPSPLSSALKTMDQIGLDQPIQSVFSQNDPTLTPQFLLRIGWVGCIGLLDQSKINQFCTRIDHSDQISAYVVRDEGRSRGCLSDILLKNV